MPAANDHLKAVSRKKKQYETLIGWLVLLFLSAAFVIGGCYTLYSFGLRQVYRLLDAQDWQPTRCVIVASAVEARRGDHGPLFRVAISYTYEFAGKAHRGDRYDFWDEFYSSGRTGKEAVVKRYSVGKEATCYVDPELPSEAVVHRGFSSKIFFGMIPLVFIVMGSGGVAYAILARKKIFAGPESTNWLPDAAQRKNRGATSHVEESSLPVELKPSQSRWGRLIGMIFFSAFWNGCISILVVTVVKGHINGAVNWIQWIQTIFVIPFALIGLVSLGIVAYMFLKLLNPLPTLKLSNSTAKLGDELQLHWKFSGNVQPIRRLQLVLKAQEEARYTVGTDTQSDRETFIELSLVDTTEKREMPSGSVSFTIPANSMHSFDAPHNKVLWSLQVHGELARWPDIDHEFPLVVLPAPNRTPSLRGPPL